jgi:4-hydroxybenzoate polyprenyltransferase
MSSDAAPAAAIAAPGAGRSVLAHLAVAMRPYQWPKNLIVFAALAFSAGDSWRLDQPSEWWPLLWRSLLLFACWCLATSGTYLVNDLRDREADRIHPRKRYRPIALGVVPPRAAWTTAATLAAAAVLAGLAIDLAAGAILAGYVAVMAAYSFGLKRVAILDVIILCAGFVARAVSGAAAIDVEISPWLYVCTSFGAFFLATSKRWAEYRELGAEAAAHRPALERYGSDLLGQLLVISAATALLSYALYTIESTSVPSNGSMALTIPFVAFGMFRFLLLLNGARRGDAPDRILFTDPQILLAVLGFVVTAVTVLLV